MVSAKAITKLKLDSIIILIEGCKNNEHCFQKAAYERYYMFALKVVFRYIYTMEDAVEVVNDGFVKFFLHIDRFRYNTATDAEKLLPGYLKKIMVNTAIDLLRKKMLLPEIGGIPDQVWEIKDKEPDAEQKLLYKDLMKLVKKLPTVYRLVFNMHVIDGYSHVEIADKLNIPVGTSKSNLMRAKALVVKYINQMEEATECIN